MTFGLWQAIRQRRRHTVSHTQALAVLERTRERLRAEILLTGKDPQLVDRLMAYLMEELRARPEETAERPDELAEPPRR